MKGMFNIVINEIFSKDMQCYLLDRKTRNEIQDKLELELETLGYDDLETDELIYNAINDCSLNDLQEVIDIYDLDTIDVL